ncbi:HAMP domain-containing histidine kinase [Myxococcota bacterium]|nr:HAMP domain-containing histidine kinase [Myxococcota bacterium]
MKNLQTSRFILWMLCLTPLLGWAVLSRTRVTHHPHDWLRPRLLAHSLIRSTGVLSPAVRRVQFRDLVEQTARWNLTLIWNDSAGRLVFGDADPGAATPCWNRIAPDATTAETDAWICGRNEHARWALEKGAFTSGGVPAWWWLTGLLPILAAVAFALDERRRRREDTQLVDAARKLAQGEMPRTDLRTPSFEAVAVMAAALREKEERLAGQLAIIEEQNREILNTREKFISQEKLITLGHLAAGLAHELGNPLAALFAHLDLLTDAGLDPRTTEHLTMMQAEIRRMDELIRRLLLLARGEEGGLASGPASEWLPDAVDILRHQAWCRDVTFTVDAAPEAMSIPVPGEWKSILVNLLVNAAQAMDGSGTVTISLVRHGDSLHIDVRDTGPGVPSELAGRIFEPFFTTKDPGTGTGLGLSVCRMLAGRAGGTLTCVPDEGGGHFVLEIQIPADLGKKGLTS